MKIEFQHVVPFPLIDQVFEANSFWKKQFSIDSSEHYMVSSPSGKGKSTFINIVYGIRKDYEGSVLLNNEPISEFPPNKWAEIRQKHLSILPQDTKLFPDLTVKENLLLKNKLTDFKSEQEIIALTDQFNLKDKWNTPCGVLSFGQQQRIGIIRSILQPFDFLLLDEPFSNIDNENIAIAKSIIENACKQTNGKMIIASLGYSYDWNFKPIFL